MSSLVHKQRQQVLTSAPDASNNKPETGNEQHQQIAQKQQNPSPVAKKGLNRRSVSFEKFLVTAFHIRLACAKCSRESLKVCLEMLIMRSRIVTEHLSLVKLAYKWNTAVLEIANVVIPKWQIKMRHIVDTAILQRECRKRQRQEKRIDTKPVAVVTPTKHVIQDAIVEEVEGKETVVKREMAAVPEKVEKATQTVAPAVIESIVGADKSSSSSQTSVYAAAQDKHMMRLGLTIAVIACVVFLAMQVLVGVALLLLSVRGMPLGLIFQVACVGYIAYLLLSICDFSRLNMTTCNYGKHNKSTTQRRVLNVPKVSDTKTINGVDKVKVTVKLVQLSFIEKTMSKVKLL